MNYEQWHNSTYQHYDDPTEYNGPDIDYCKRAIANRWKIVLATGIFIFHNHHTTFRSRFSVSSRAIRF